MLLVLGCCFFFGGDQKFSKVGAVANMSLLLLSSLALVLPTPLSHASVSLLRETRCYDLGRRSYTARGKGDISNPNLVVESLLLCMEFFSFITSEG